MFRGFKGVDFEAFGFVGLGFIGLFELLVMARGLNSSGTLRSSTSGFQCLGPATPPRIRDPKST